MPTLAPAPEEIRDLMEEVIDEFFSESLRPCEPPINIALLLSSDLAKNGFPVSALTEATNEKERATAGTECYDCRIILDLDDWTRRKERSRRGVLADALYALEPQGQMEHPKDEKPFFRCKLDTHNRPIVKIKKPDYRACGYVRVAEWFGEDSPEIRSHKAIGEMLGQLPLPFEESAPADVPASRERPPVTYGSGPKPSGPARAFDPDLDAPPVGPISAALRESEREALALAEKLGCSTDPAFDGMRGRAEAAEKSRRIREDIDTTAELIAGLDDVADALKEIEAEAEKQSTEYPPDLERPDDLRRALPITFLEMSDGIKAALWLEADIATVGELEDCLYDAMSSAAVTLAKVAKLHDDQAEAVVVAMDRLRDGHDAGVKAAASPADVAAILPAPVEVLEQTPDGAIVPLERMLEEESDADAEDSPVGAQFKAYDVGKTPHKTLGTFLAGSGEEAWEKAVRIWPEVAPTKLQVMGTGEASRAMLETARKAFVLGRDADRDAEEQLCKDLDAAKPKKPRKPKAKPAPEPDPLEDLFIYWSGHNPIYALKAPSLAAAVAWVKEQHPKDAKATVKPDLDGTAAKRHLTLMGDLRQPKHTVPGYESAKAAAIEEAKAKTAPAPPAGFAGSEVKEVFRCNRCNELRPCLIHPCPNCECPEYGIVEVPRATADRLAEIHTKPAKAKRRSRKPVEA